jgi:hypothetical protein
VFTSLEELGIAEALATRLGRPQGRRRSGADHFAFVLGDGGEDETEKWAKVVKSAGIKPE